MAVDVFLKIKGIPGESADSKHKGEIDVLSYSWGISQTGTMSYGGGGGAGKANFSDFSFMMRMNKATPKLMQACANGSQRVPTSGVAEPRTRTAPERCASSSATARES